MQMDEQIERTSRWEGRNIFFLKNQKGGMISNSLGRLIANQGLCHLWNKVKRWCGQKFVGKLKLH